ncbi:DUF996 domain-containing protein [Aliarcobacter cryaerophilus]|uniref:DUF996 domain-containing protein n=1 Tax=Aliarcobacter cryaerophilus TaxID=28198 RepID=A0A2S9TI63_9BACT|nr:DUF996 domain-containing protein [Aliarcobacter cryaerophilus]PRM98548.1 hypothetical protein CJ670_02905 [Arcobacter cryaerophilus gv. crypticus]
MKGKILDYNIQESTGIISGDDGERYSFSNSEWKASESPKVNQTVDFEIDGQSAKAIYLLKSQVTDFASSLNIDGSEARKGAVFAAIGSGLTFLSIIPILGILFLVGGIILEFIGVKKLSDNAPKQRDIFINFIWGYGAIILGTVIMTMILGASMIGGAMNMDNAGSGIGMGGMFFGIFIYLGFAIYGVIKMYKAINSIGIEYNVSLMKLVAKGYVIGIVLVPLFGIGYLVLFITFILKIFAYLKIEKQ